MKNISFLGALLCILSVPLTAQNSQKQLTLNQLLDSAIANNYLLQANDKSTLIKQAEIEILKTNYLPKVSTSASFSYWKFLLPNKQKMLGSSFTDMYTDVVINQTIYDWGETRVKKESVAGEIRLNEEIKRQISSTIVWGVADAYFEAIKANVEHEVHQTTLVQLNDHLKYAENLYGIGKASGVDILKIKVQISVEEKNMQKAHNAIQSQLIRLKKLCSLNDRTDLEIEDISHDIFLKMENTQPQIDSLYTEVLQNHPALRAAEQKIVLENRQKEIIRLQNRPELYSYGVTSWEHAYIPFADNFNYNIGVGLRYTLPYWGGRSYKSRLLQSEYRIEQIVDEKQQTYRDICREIDLVINNLADIRDEIANNEKIILLADETLQNSRVKYQAGQGPIVDILDAQTIITQANIVLKKSKLSFIQAIVKLHYLTGSDTYPL